MIQSYTNEIEHGCSTINNIDSSIAMAGESFNTPIFYSDGIYYPYKQMIALNPTENTLNYSITNDINKLVNELNCDWSCNTKNNDEEKNNMMNNVTSFMNGMFGKVSDGMVKLSIDGRMAVKTNAGYKAYDVASGALTNCDNFVFNVGQEMFFVIPTNKVQIGDIILVSGKPHCVTKIEKNAITCLRYEDSTIVTVVPERHMFMGKTYFYGKIISIFGNCAKNPSSIMKYMMLSSMMGGNSSSNFMSNMNPMMMYMMMGNGNGLGDMFSDIFDSFDDEDDADTNSKED